MIAIAVMGSLGIGANMPSYGVRGVLLRTLRFTKRDRLTAVTSTPTSIRLTRVRVGVQRMAEAAQVIQRPWHS